MRTRTARRAAVELFDRAAGAARGDLLLRQIAEPEQEIVQPVGVARLVVRVERLQLLLDFFERRPIQQLAKIRAAENLFELRLIDGKRLRAAFRERRVAIIYIVGDVREQQRAGEGRRLGRIDRRHANGAALHLLEDIGGCFEVEDLAHAFAIRLQQHRKAGVARRHGQQVGGALALLPERRADSGAPARQEERARGGFAELRGEERRAAQLAEHQILQFGGGGKQPLRLQRLFAFRHAQHEAVVAPHGFGLDAAFGAQLRRRRHAPRRVYAAAERREDADAPIAELVAAALDHDVAIAGHASGGGGLILQVAHQVFGGAGVEAVLVDQAREGRGARHIEQFARHLADLAAELRGTARRCRRARTASCRVRRGRGRRSPDRA